MVLFAVGVLLEVAHEDVDRLLISAEKDRIVTDVLFRRMAIMRGGSDEGKTYCSRPTSRFSR